MQCPAGTHSGKLALSIVRSATLIVVRCTAAPQVHAFGGLDFKLVAVCCHLDTLLECRA